MPCNATAMQEVQTTYQERQSGNFTNAAIAGAYKELQGCGPIKHKRQVAAGANVVFSKPNGVAEVTASIPADGDGDPPFGPSSHGYGKEINNTIRPISAGLNGLYPNPPKTCSHDDRH